MCHAAQGFSHIIHLKQNINQPSKEKNISKAEREKTIVAMYNNGHSIDDIWKVSGFSSRSSVFRILNKYGVSLNRASSAGRLGNVNQKMSNDMVKNRIEEEKKGSKTNDFFILPKKESNASLCPACHELLTYARDRLNHCKFGNDKQLVKVSCTLLSPGYEKADKNGYAMVRSENAFYHPVSAVKHLLREL